MAITGTGTQADPFIITTYDELVEKAATASEVFIKVGNDINIAEEYPLGDMPPLIITHARIDGDGKIVSNWYSTGSTDLIQITGSSSDTTRNPQIKNLNFFNILTMNGNFVNPKYGTGAGIGMFKSCNFQGECYNRFSYSVSSNSGKRDHFIGCSINIDNHASSPFAYYTAFEKCRIIVKTSGAQLFTGDIDNYLRDCYITATMTNSSAKFCSSAAATNNCILDVYTSSSNFVNAGKATTSYPISIINSAHAPAAVKYAGNLYAVSAEHWYDVPYLQNLGFLCAAPSNGGGGS